jgi:hypothetical protein
LSAPLVGYKAYLTAARLTLLGFTALSEKLPNEQATPPYMSIVASALDLVCEPRLHEDIMLVEEALLVEDLRRFHLHLSWLNRSDREALLAAWGRLQASGVIARRSMEQMLKDNDCKVKEQAAKAQADADALGLRSCAHCSAQEVHVQALRRLQGQGRAVLQQGMSASRVAGAQGGLQGDAPGGGGGCCWGRMICNDDAPPRCKLRLLHPPACGHKTAGVHNRALMPRR